LAGRLPWSFEDERGSHVRASGEGALGAEGEELVDGRYRIREPLGRGGMGAVFRAEDVFLERSVALKIVDPEGGEQAFEAFKKEARALARIRHDNVVQIYAFGVRESGAFYFAMEDVEGRDLGASIDEEAAQGRTLPIARSLSILRDVARGLDAVHARGIVHRDVKPGNVVIEAETGRPVLIDFGLARRARSASTPDAPLVGGTPWYMAPEQATDPRGDRVSPRADLYALACIAFELLTGRPPFDGDDSFEVLVQHVKEPPPPISSVAPELAPFDAALARAMAKDPALRHESCGAFVAELEAAARRVRATSVPPASRAPSRRPAAPRVRLLALMDDENLRRHVVRSIERALDGARVEADAVASAGALIESFAREPADIVVVDDESTTASSDRVVGAVRAARAGAQAEVLVFVRNPTKRSQRLLALGARELPKPIVLHVVGVVLARMAAAVAERRAAARVADTIPPPPKE
jgi:serine/threonine-protein kinase